MMTLTRLGNSGILKLLTLMNAYKIGFSLDWLRNVDPHTRECPSKGYSSDKVEAQSNEKRFF